MGKKQKFTKPLPKKNLDENEESQRSSAVNRSDAGNHEESSFQNEEFSLDSRTKLLTLIIIVIVVLLSAVFYSYWNFLRNPGYVVLPGGITYLGPSRAPKPTPLPSDGLFHEFPNEIWTKISGKIFPFIFEKPSSLTLLRFPGDTTDALAIEWRDRPPQQNILIHVENLKTNKSLAKYRNIPKKVLIEKYWWTQYGAYSGVQDVIEFTNSKGTTGYKTRFITTDGKTPNEDVFFEVPNQKDYIIRFGNGILAQSIFDKIIDTFEWTTNNQTP